MIPPVFEYVRAATIPEAVSLLQLHGDDAKILSGGQSLIPMMKLRLARPAWLIDINHIPGLAYIREDGGHLKIGGLTREADIEELGPDPLEVPDYPRYGAGDRRSAGAQSGDHRRKPGARRSGQRSSGHHAGARSRGGRHRARTASERSRFRSSFCRSFPPRSSTMRSSPRFAFRFPRRAAAALTSSWSGRWAISPRRRSRRR